MWYFWTGDIEDFPGVDSLPCYSVSTVPLEDGGALVKVRARQSDLEKNKRVKCLHRKDADNNTTIVVVGGGMKNSLFYLIYI